MVVDDEQTVRVLLSRMLKREGYDVVLAGDSVVALELLKRHRPDLVILDIVMPGLNGFQVLPLMRQHSDVPVIMLTAKGETAALREALGLGADDYVRKPFQALELLARIRAKLRRASQEVTVPVEEVDKGDQ
jgi:DNA-binding response OmpR family regulator